MSSVPFDVDYGSFFGSAYAHLVPMDDGNYPSYLEPDVVFSNGPDVTQLRFNSKKEESVPLLNRDHPDPTSPLTHVEDSDFQGLIRQAEAAIEAGIQPQRISRGSSGSYFVYNSDRKTIGVFKPKDEEPYGRLNPKWTKWLHKNCCPCCFGRGCLIPNQGYMSESGASLVDRKFKLDIVPVTYNVRLTSQSFNYDAMARAKFKAKKEIAEKLPSMSRGFKRIALPPKIGSFQKFVPKHKDADYWLKRWEEEPPPDPLKRAFQLQFERLVVLDYLIRNTDRGNDNWLIQYTPPNEEETDLIGSGNVSTPNEGQVHVAAIDNGLAFPFKHPDEWRTYPYYWAWLAQAKIPFSDSIRQHMLPYLNDRAFTQQLIDELFHLFRQDEAFDRYLFECQMAVMRGQILNLTQALVEQKSPLQLVQMPVMFVERADKEFTQRFGKTRPCFSCI